MVVFRKDRGIVPGALVEIESLADDGRRGAVRGFLARPYAIPHGSIGAYYQETSPLLLPRCQKQDAGGKVDPRPGQAAVRGMQRSHREFTLWVRAHKRDEVGAASRAQVHER